MKIERFYIRKSIKLLTLNTPRKINIVIHRYLLFKSFVFEIFKEEQYENFDEEMTVCEDYDLWLRISHLYPICFINEKKIVKYGGHEDQLSSKYWGMDQFRVKALEKMLQKKSLSSEDRTATIKMLHRKCDILANGFLKREKNEQAEYFDSLKNNYSIK